LGSRRWRLVTKRSVDRWNLRRSRRRFFARSSGVAGNEPPPFAEHTRHNRGPGATGSAGRPRFRWNWQDRTSRHGGAGEDRDVRRVVTMTATAVHDGRLGPGRVGARSSSEGKKDKPFKGPSSRGRQGPTNDGGTRSILFKRRKFPSERRAAITKITVLTGSHGFRGKRGGGRELRRGSFVFGEAIGRAKRRRRSRVGRCPGGPPPNGKAGAETPRLHLRQTAMGKPLRQEAGKSGSP